MKRKVLVATDKPFAAKAIDGIRGIVEGAGYELCLLEKYGTADKLQEAVGQAGVEALIVRSDKVTADVIQAAKDLKIVVRAGAGYDNLDLAACTAREITAMNTPGQNANAVAELAIGLMIYMARNGWNPGTGSELRGKRLGIHGYGHIGKLIAELAQGLKMEVYTCTKSASAEELKKLGITQLSSLEELFSSCDYISVHIPSTPTTQKMIGYDLIGKMPKGGILINTSRKDIIDEEGLLKVLIERNDLRYATDTAPDSLAAIQEKVGNRVFATPKKMGAETAEANINAGVAAAQQIVNFFEKGDIRFKVN